MAGAQFSIADISASGMMAERHRMEVIANNIANAQSTRSSDGGPFRRQQVVFSAAMDSHSSHNNGRYSLGSTGSIADGFAGVRVLGIQSDESEFESVHNPGHPDADKVTGMVLMPNVSVPNEMVDLITATRSYEANLKAMKNFREMTEQTLSILRG